MRHESNTARIRMLLNDGAVGFVDRGHDASFYVLFDAVHRSSDLLIEMTFNPEYVDLGGIDPTDVVLHWGKVSEVERWIREFLAEFQVELCPASLRSRAEERLFGAGARDIQIIDPSTPWQFLYES